MKLNLLIHSAALTSRTINSFGIGTVRHIRLLAEHMQRAGIKGDLYDLPNGSRAASMASPFSLTNGFALNVDELDLAQIPELGCSDQAQRLYQSLLKNYQATVVQEHRINYSLVRTVAPLLFDACFAQFKSGTSPARAAAFADFQQRASYWLAHYAMYEVYKETGLDLSDRAYADLAAPKTRAFAQEHGDRIAYFTYLQFLCFEQRMALLRAMRELDVGLIINVPFGVESLSADVYFHPDVFDHDLQIGCSPEPENGYPEQLWGLAAYRERSDALKQYLAHKMRWLGLFGSGVFFDHMVGWCGQYVIDRAVKGDPAHVYGRFLDTAPERRSANLRWFLNIVFGENLSIRGEVFGDRERLDTTVEVMSRYAQDGCDISVLRIPWKRDGASAPPLAHYGASDLVAYGTHDIETPLQYLCDLKGGAPVGDAPGQLLSYCREVLGLPFFSADVPLLAQATGDPFAAELARRMFHGVRAANVLITLPGLVSLLSAHYRDCSARNNINCRPGTSGEVDNVNGNWSHCSPPVEALTEDAALRAFLGAAGRRRHVGFDPFRPLAVAGAAGVQAIGAKTAGRNAVVKDAAGRWGLAGTGPAEDAPVYEFVVLNNAAAPASVHVDLAGLAEEWGETAYFVLRQEQEGAARRELPAGALRTPGFPVSLQAFERRHVFVALGRPATRAALPE